MTKKGKSFEKTITLIHETLRDSSNTQIFTNFQIANESKAKREFDILIIAKINGIELKIAIECKDYKGRIPVEKIEAFHSKCDRIKEINKKVFVSSNGFQKDAINAAHYYNIDLFTANEITKESIIQWFTVKKLMLKILPQFTAPTMYLDAEEESMPKLKDEFCGYIHLDDTNEAINIKNILMSNVEENKHELWGVSLLEWIRLSDQNKFEPFPVKFRLTLNNCSIITKNDHRTKLLGLDSSVYVQFIEADAKIISARTYKDEEGKTKANTIQVETGSKTISEIIINEKNETTIFTTDEKGLTYKLNTICTFNRESNSFNYEQIGG